MLSEAFLDLSSILEYIAGEILPPDDSSDLALRIQARQLPPPELFDPPADW